MIVEGKGLVTSRLFEFFEIFRDVQHCNIQLRV